MNAVLPGCGGGGSGGEGNTGGEDNDDVSETPTGSSNGIAGDFAVIVGESDHFYAHVAAGSAAIERRTGFPLGAPRSLVGLTHDADDDVLVGFLSRNRELVTLDPVNGALTLLGPLDSAVDLASLALAPASGVLYGITTGPEPELVSIDRATRTTATVGEVAFFNTRDLAYDPDTDRLYTVHDDRLSSGASELLAIDPATGAGTVAGLLEDFLERLAVDPDTGSLYGLNRSTNRLRELDKSDGSITSRFINPTGYTQPNALTFNATSGQLQTVASNPDNRGQVLIDISPTNGRGTFRAALGFDSIGGMAHDPSNGTLYATDVSGDWLIEIDTGTGRGKRIGDLGFDEIAGLAWDATSGVLYGVDAATGQLAVIEPTSGAASAVAVTGIKTLRSLAHDPETGTLYGVDQAANTLVRIDKTTAEVTEIGPLGAADVDGLAYDPGRDRLLASARNADGNGRLLAVDPLTGAATTIGDTGMDRGPALAFARDTGTVFGYNAGAGTLLRLDPVTGRGSGVNHTGFFRVTGMALDPARERVFTIAGGGRVLAALDVATGEGVAIGPLSVDAVNDLAFDPNAEVLYAYDRDRDQLLTIDTATGATSVVGPSGASFLQTLTYDALHDVLYADSGRHLYTLDTATGTATPVGAERTLRLTSITHDADSDTLFGVGIENNAGSTLYRIDRTTGSLTPLRDYDYQIRFMTYR